MTRWESPCYRPEQPRPHLRAAEAAEAGHAPFLPACPLEPRSQRPNTARPPLLNARKAGPVSRAAAWLKIVKPASDSAGGIGKDQVAVVPGPTIVSTTSGSTSRSQPGKPRPASGNGSGMAPANRVLERPVIMSPTPTGMLPTSTLRGRPMNGPEPGVAARVGTPRAPGQPVPNVS